MIAVRRAVPEDAERIADIQLVSWRDAYAHLLSAEFLARMEPRPDAYRRAIEAARAEFHVAEVDGEVVGFAIAGVPRHEPDAPRDWELSLLYQYPRMHGSGTGQALLDTAVGDRPCFLWVADDNPRAHAFYRRNGFQSDGATRVISEWEDLLAVRLVR